MKLKEFYLKYEKIVLVLLVIVVFSAVYFSINYLTSFRQTYQLNIFIDNLIPFLPLTILIYQFTYVLWFLPYFLVKKVEPLRKLTWSYIILLLASAVVFLVFPVRVIRPEMVSGGLVSWLVNTFYSMDLPYNAFPSIHASYTFLVGFFSFKYLKELGLIIYLMAIFIIISTLTFKQHYFLDAAAGILLATGVYLALFRK
ncbi:MAG: phosphatase PAP2 family protein [Nanoarchaeota archaeon]|nr:phosphatase PAP2 family protein [Nanoarchaeota archaeon]